MATTIELKNTVGNYINGYLFMKQTEKGIDEALAEKIDASMRRLERKLYELGVTNKQIDKILYCAKYFHQAKTKKVKVGQLDYVMQMIEKIKE